MLYEEQQLASRDTRGRGDDTQLTALEEPRHLLSRNKGGLAPDVGRSQKRALFRRDPRMAGELSAWRRHANHPHLGTGVLTNHRVWGRRRRHENRTKVNRGLSRGLTRNPLLALAKLPRYIILLLPQTPRVRAALLDFLSIPPTSAFALLCAVKFDFRSHV